MTQRRTHARIATTGALAAALIAAIACSSSAPPSDEAPGLRGRAFTNGGFETGNANQRPPSWTVTPYLNETGLATATPTTFAELQLTGGGVATTYTEVSATGPLTQTDPALGNAATLRWPRYGDKCAVVNGPNDAATWPKGVGIPGADHNANEMSQTMTIGATDVDPLDRQVHVRFAYAPVLQQPTHATTDQPYYFVQLINVTQGNKVLFTDFNLSGSAASWSTLAVNGVVYDYTDWQVADISGAGGAMVANDQVTLTIVASGCEPGGHWGELYVDGVGAVLPGISVEGTGPAQANAGSSVTYTMTYRDASPSQACTTSANCIPQTEACVAGFCAETGVTLTFTTPANTTFESMTPPAGATCTTPPVGGTGTITCTFTNPVASDTSGTFSVTVNVDGGATGTITETSYDIYSTQETPIYGPSISTLIGCTADSQCAAGYWCDEALKACTAQLANGQPIPKDGTHTNPTLNGICGDKAAQLVCVSGVCDAKDDKCGYANGDGPCVPGATGNGGVVCRSGECSTTDVCMAAGSCDSDADCAGNANGTLCDTTKHTCGTCTSSNSAACTGTTPVCDKTGANDVCAACSASYGVAGTDPCPTAALPACVLGGASAGACVQCTSSAACAAATPVCDATTDTCVVCNGDNGSTATDACPSSASSYCASSGTCGACASDTDCTAGTHSGPYCNQTTGACGTTCFTDAECGSGNWCDNLSGPGVCQPKVSNGVQVPGGTCDATIAGRACLSGVCDTKDSDCGYANGDGPCPGTTGAAVCRSTICATTGPNAGLCEQCVSGTTCAAATPVCDATTDTCVVCNGDNGSSATDACPSSSSPYCASSGTCGACASDTDCTTGTHAGPYCDTTTGACGNNCFADAECGAGSWCDDLSGPGICQPKVSNGIQVPGGTCTTTLGGRACVSGVCDTKDNKCGFANGDGPCSGSTVCRSALCATTGPDTGLCEQCLSSTTCTSTTPVCDVATDTCVVCNGDNGSSATDSCPSSTLPYCASAGTCGKCGSDTDCTTGTHAGPYCNKTTGACGTTCSTDAECGAGDWCDNLSGPGVCEPKVPNGQPVPGGTCTTTIGKRACVAGVCDPGDDLCGPVPSDGGVDGGVVDSGPADTGAGDAGLVDSGAADTGAGDAGLADSGAADTGNDASRREAGADAGRDASKREAGMDAAEDAAGDADSNATGYAQGGGCKTATGTSPRAPLPWIGVAALVLARVRARRRERATKR